MSILLIDHPLSLEELNNITKEFPTYIKLMADVQEGILFGGGRLHADMEKLLLEQGSKQNNIWGGGVDLDNKVIDCLAVANIRSNINPSEEILDPEIRQKFVNLVKLYFLNYGGQ